MGVNFLTTPLTAEEFGPIAMYKAKSIAEKFFKSSTEKTDHSVDEKESLKKIKELSPREIEVLRLIASGLTSNEIAEKMGLTPGTVKKYVGMILRKMRVPGRKQAADLALKLNLIQKADSNR
jgi:DNA-binding NarL/FixJ family response regulator